MKAEQICSSALPGTGERRDAAARQASKPGRLVTDAPTRMFHWLFACSFLGAYLSADGEQFRLLHVTLGYTMAGLLVFRLLYGLFGPRQASVGALWRKLSNAPYWFQAAARSKSLTGINWRQGQNLLMALAVIVLLAMLVPLTLTGYGTYNGWDEFLGGDWLEELHEFFGEAYLFVVLAHLGLIAGISMLRRQNQALPMLTGRVATATPGPVKKNRTWLAILLLLAVLSYWSWEWQQPRDALAEGRAASRQQVDNHD